MSAKTPAEVVRELPAEVFVAIARGEGYEDVCDQILAEDAFGPRNPFEWRVVDRAALSAPQGEAVAAVEVFRIAGGDVECCPNPTAEQAMECLRDLRECYNESLAAPPPQQAEQGQEWAPMNHAAAWLTNNKPLHPETVNLVVRFARALAEKLSAAEAKYGYSDGWLAPDWMDECRQKLVEHIAKGDPRDVAAYCAFLWHHGESTTPPQQREGGEVRVTKQMCHRAIDAYTDAVGEGWQMPCVQGMYAALDAALSHPIPAQQPGEVAVTDEMVEAAAKALWEHVGFEPGFPDWLAADPVHRDTFRGTARAALTAALTTGGRNG